ncbi:urease accessory protein UreE [Rhodobacter sp. Har01]|uniref:urease accessory protein UreE n=1 Tax=Rhodobacter sp. Har01 TaxID=2883999 RepID=UPI001D0706B1|nr:urease accessory protein UreE [Rhodobacter sp. Har01]MCB6177840.1 urease accessory protein UreE [Rhodobacter sp. Har01]
MGFPLPARKVLRAGEWSGPVAGRVTLSYDERFLRRKRLVCDDGRGVLVDLAATTSLEAGDALETDDGQRIEVAAADEPVVQVRGTALARLAWHIGNRHTPCQVAGDHLVIRQDHVLEAMLLQLGAQLVHVIAPFRPEGGAYGHGRTLGHDHGPHGFPHV